MAQTGNSNNSPSAGSPSAHNIEKNLQLWAEDEPVDRTQSDPDFTVDVDGFEGPLDLLLAMARTQKVDLTRISILQLAMQYLEFVEKARSLRLELAADYLVMAAWLAYLKSRLLLPAPEGDPEPTGEELAAQLAFRLQRLEAMREASVRLMNRNRLGQDIFARGDPEPVEIDRQQNFSASLFDLLTAYAQQRQRTSVSEVTIAQRDVWSLSDARDIITRLMGELGEWTPLNTFLARYLTEDEDRPGVIASSFAASLELVREGVLEMRQHDTFAPIYMRAQTAAAAATPPLVTPSQVES
ncbi:MAG: ScpA family protein [Pseudomonadota bacterium]